MRKVIENLRAIRENKGISQEEVAKLIYKTQSSYARIERGVTKIDLETLDLFASAMQMSMVDVITYPEKFINVRDLPAYQESKTKAILQIELSEEKKKEVIKSLFGEDNIKLFD